MCRGTLGARRTQAHEKDLEELFVYVAFGIGIAYRIEIAIDGYSDVDADSDPGILRYQLFSEQSLNRIGTESGRCG